ncbi:unnamed protein product [Cladocopium goreaui]|uniref:Uncharacterized protein n=1 Tax=Cladocopium goreaui TaxID=2562237 RepID=A0A9P1FZL0_9DINO|nr:unnamed protein product [Cladocopium goreaui]
MGARARGRGPPSQRYSCQNSVFWVFFSANTTSAANVAASRRTRTSEGASPEDTDNMPVSDDLSVSVPEQLGNAETSDFLSGRCALDDIAFGDGELGRQELPMDSTTGPNHGQAQRVSRNCAALALGASQVPRGPVISESSFEQLLSHAYLGTKGQLTVKMPWERGVFKKVFQKPATGIQHVFQQPRIWVNYNLESVAETLEDLHEQTAKRPELVGVQGREWITAAKMAFKDYGLSLEGHIGGPLFRPPGADGNSHCKRGLTSQEVSRFLRVMLGENMTHDKESGPKLSSHSLKATVLSWAAKAGMAAQDKSILGRHVSAYTDSSAVYARDLSIGAVSRLQEVVLQIYRGEFLPDAPRSGYYPVAMPVAEAPELPDAEVIKVEDDAACQELDMEVPVADSQLCEEACSASSDGSESLEGSDSEEEIVPPAPKCYRHVAAGPLEGKFVMHKVSHLVHYVDSGVKGGLATKVISCGGALNNNYKTVERFDTVDVCRRCKTNATKDEAQFVQRTIDLKLSEELKRSLKRTHEVLNQKSPTKQLDISAESLVVKEKHDTPDMTVTSALQVQEAFQRRGIALVFADLITHESYTRYLTTLFGHLHRDPPTGYARTTVSQLVTADRTVWQMLLEEGVQPKRDEMGNLALDTKLMESLQSYRVSFSLLPLIAKKDATPSPTKITKPSISHGGKGANLQVQKPWIKNKGGKKGDSAEKMPSVQQHQPMHGVELTSFDFSNEQLKGPVVIEVFCGSARVTASLKEVGLTQSFGVDHVLDKVPIAPMQRLKDAWQIPAACSSKMKEIPAGAQLLRQTPLRISGGKSHPGSTTTTDTAEVFGADVFEQAWGIPFSPKEFMEEAVARGHPKLFARLEQFQTYKCAKFASSKGEVVFKMDRKSKAVNRV